MLPGWREAASVSRMINVRLRHQLREVLVAQVSSPMQTCLGTWAETGLEGMAVVPRRGSWAVLYQKGWPVQGTSLVEEMVLAGKMGECECAGGSGG